MNQIAGNEKISPTAWTIAYRRTFTDIPYSKEIFNEIERLQKEQGVQIANEFKSYGSAPQLEARYRLVNRLINEKQILEIAAGFSPRGLDLTEKDPDIMYVEVDLDGLMNNKRNIIEKFGSRKNLYLENGSALDLESLKAAAKHFDNSKPLAVIHEGLLRYLNFDEKAIVAKNIHSLLEEFGGVWITPDITLKTVLKEENKATNDSTSKVSQTIGIDFSKTSFGSIEEAKLFFQDQGFTVEQHLFSEVIDDLVSPNKLNLSRDQVLALISLSPVFVMRLK